MTREDIVGALLLMAACSLVAVVAFWAGVLWMIGRLT